MDKEFMLEQAKARLTSLKAAYRNACNSIGLKGQSLTYAGAACLRKRLKKDICSLELVLELLEGYRFNEIKSPDAILGFEKLIGD